MRCVALAQEWQDRGGRANLVGRLSSPELAARLRREEIELDPLDAEPGSAEDAAATLRRARAAEAAWIVVDGYRFGSAFQRSIKESGIPLLWIDDFGHAPPYCADLVLNQNLHASDEIYHHRSPATRLLLGPRFALLRRDFRSLHGWRRRTRRTARRLLVTLGGSDAGNVGAKVLEALGRLDRPSLETRIVIGPVCPHRDELRDIAHRLRPRVEVLPPVDDLAPLIRWADFGVTTAGSTIWELAFLGLPAVLLVVAANQAPSAAMLTAQDLALSLGTDAIEPSCIEAAVDRLAADQRMRSRFSRGLQKLVDGLGSARVCEAMSSSTEGVGHDHPS